MVTLQQLDEALKLILQFRAQLQKENQHYNSEEIYIYIQNKISPNTFWAIQNYYSDFYNIDLEWDDLKAMSIDKLKLLNYERLRLYRGFGVKSEMKLRKLLEPYTKHYEEQRDGFLHKIL
jgi:hypothetical protein